MKTIHSNPVSRRRFILRLPVAFCAATCLSWLAMAPAANAADSGTAKPIRVACVGDSITYGSHIKDHQHDTYPADLGRMLGNGYDVRNFGHSGATLLKKGNLPYFKVKEHSAALKFKPDIVVIMLGTNDSKHRGDGSLDADHAVDNWQYKADFVPDYKDLIAEFRQANPKVKVYVCLPTPCFPGRWGINNKTIHDEVIPLTRQVARDTGASIIDLNSALDGKKNLFPDTVHPNPAGAQLMADAVYQALIGKPAPTHS